VNSSLKKLRIFDFDDTLALTDSSVRVMRGDKVVHNLNSSEFKNYKLKDGERFDSSAFDKVLNPKIIKPMMMAIRKVLGKPSPAVVLTGRGKAEPVKEWLASIGVNVEVHAVGAAAKNTADIAKMKRKWIVNAIKRGGWEYIEVFEDSKENLTAMESLKSEFPNVKFVLRYVGQYAEKMKEGRDTLRFGSWLSEATNKRKIHDQTPVKSMEDLHKLAIAASKKHKDEYIIAYVDFGLATVFATNKLPTSVYASDDWKLGYWRNGKHFEWSDARKRQTRMAIDRLSGLQ